MPILTDGNGPGGAAPHDAFMTPRLRYITTDWTRGCIIVILVFMATSTKTSLASDVEIVHRVLARRCAHDRRG
jgi:hypothetical protein